MHASLHMFHWAIYAFALTKALPRLVHQGLHEPHGLPAGPAAAAYAPAECISDAPVHYTRHLNIPLRSGFRSQEACRRRDVTDCQPAMLPPPPNPSTLL